MKTRNNDIGKLDQLDVSFFDDVARQIFTDALQDQFSPYSDDIDLTALAEKSVTAARALVDALNTVHAPN